MKKGVTDYLLNHKTVDVKELAEEFKANEGCLNIALRSLCSQGWLTQEVDNDQNTVQYSINEVSEIAFNHFPLL
jgi:predicted transcriptional regulator